jgi:hypothetical protein
LDNHNSCGNSMGYRANKYKLQGLLDIKHRNLRQHNLTLRKVCSYQNRRSICYHHKMF